MLEVIEMLGVAGLLGDIEEACAIEEAPVGGWTEFVEELDDELAEGAMEETIVLSCRIVSC